MPLPSLAPHRNFKRERHEKDISKIPYSVDSTRSIIDGKNKRKEFLFIPR
jgi:hypothetical protein